MYLSIMSTANAHIQYFSEFFIKTKPVGYRPLSALRMILNHVGTGQPETCRTVRRLGTPGREGVAVLRWKISRKNISCFFGRSPFPFSEGLQLLTQGPLLIGKAVNFAQKSTKFQKNPHLKYPCGTSRSLMNQNLGPSFNQVDTNLTMSPILEVAPQLTLVFHNKPSLLLAIHQTTSKTLIPVGKQYGT